MNDVETTSRPCRPAINQTAVFQGNGRSEARMVMKTGGRYRRDNIPRGRVSSSRRCQRRQARPRRPRTSASRRLQNRPHLGISCIPSCLPSFLHHIVTCVTRVPACVYVPASIPPPANRSFPLSVFPIRSFQPLHYRTYRARYRA